LNFSECVTGVCKLIDQAGRGAMSIEGAKVSAISIIAEYSESRHEQTMRMLKNAKPEKSA
jgi:hypothetical protein